MDLSKKSHLIIKAMIETKKHKKPKIKDKISYFVIRKPQKEMWGVLLQTPIKMLFNEVKNAVKYF